MRLPYAAGACRVGFAPSSNGRSYADLKKYADHISNIAKQRHRTIEDLRKTVAQHVEDLRWARATIAGHSKDLRLSLAGLKLRDQALTLRAHKLRDVARYFAAVLSERDKEMHGIDRDTSFSEWCEHIEEKFKVQIGISEPYDWGTL